ncbi:NUDIX hydrolase [Streptomyces sulphureus]|uniref:NUDIX hydrolase n=1 Tax=Streptomyces sulphureus TaxID=47758 RepID=UPI0003A9D21D|nr:NUDIX hydrolase [Streptomyces sulphureus]
MAVETIRAAGCVLWRHPTGGEEIARAEPAGGAAALQEGVPEQRTDAVPPRLDPAAIELALVHRPRYDDWSFPKGHLEDEEQDDPLRAALREVLEETGFTCEPDAPLTTQRYRVGPRPKEVYYWAAEASGGIFVPNEEVDRLVWLPPAEARAQLTHEQDRELVDELLFSLRGRAATPAEPA